MTRDLQSLIERWDGVGIVCRYDTVSGTWIFICLHDNTLGACTGGTRMAVYESPAEGLRDAMRLAEGMTCKWAAINEPVGGGKAVLAVARPLEGEDRRQLLLRYGALVESLNGAFRTGEDLGTTSCRHADHCREMSVRARISSRGWQQGRSQSVHRPRRLRGHQERLRCRLRLRRPDGPHDPDPRSGQRGHESRRAPGRSWRQPVGQRHRRRPHRRGSSAPRSHRRRGCGGLPSRLRHLRTLRDRCHPQRSHHPRSALPHCRGFRQQPTRRTRRRPATPGTSRSSMFPTTSSTLVAPSRSR